MKVVLKKLNLKIEFSPEKSDIYNNEIRIIVSKAYNKVIIVEKKVLFIYL